jgi:hypothetical protein
MIFIIGVCMSMEGAARMILRIKYMLMLMQIQMILRFLWRIIGWGLEVE